MFHVGVTDVLHPTQKIQQKCSHTCPTSRCKPAISSATVYNEPAPLFTGLFESTKLGRLRLRLACCPLFTGLFESTKLGRLRLRLACCPQVSQTNIVPYRSYNNTSRHMPYLDPIPLYAT